MVQTPDLTIIEAGNGTVNSTDTVRFTITVSNTGPGTAYSVNLNDPLPGPTWPGRGDAGTITSATLRDAIGNLGSGQSVTIHLSSPTAAGYSATLNNTATATRPTARRASASATDMVPGTEPDHHRGGQRHGELHRHGEVHDHGEQRAAGDRLQRQPQRPVACSAG